MGSLITKKIKKVKKMKMKMKKIIREIMNKKK
jgi:hypothetical protein